MDKIGVVGILGSLKEKKEKFSEIIILRGGAHLSAWTFWRVHPAVWRKILCLISWSTSSPFTPGQSLVETFLKTNQQTKISVDGTFILPLGYAFHLDWFDPAGSAVFVKLLRGLSEKMEVMSRPFCALSKRVPTTVGCPPHGWGACAQWHLLRCPIAGCASLPSTKVVEWA